MNGVTLPRNNKKPDPTKPINITLQAIPNRIRAIPNNITLKSFIFIIPTDINDF